MTRNYSAKNCARYRCLGQNSQVLRKYFQSADDFLDSELGQDMLDSICMMLIAVGENFKSIDRHTDGKLLAQYPDINWKGVKGVRDVISHQYFNIDAEEIFYICSHDLEKLRETVNTMIEDLRR